MNPKLPHQPLLGFAPDADPTTPGVLVDCDRMIPTPRGMEVAPDPNASAFGTYGGGYTGVIPVNGAAFSSADEVVVLLGADDKLWVLSVSGGVVGTWTDRSRGGGYARSSTAGPWSFEAFGTEFYAASDSAIPLQRATGPGVPFANVTGPSPYVITASSRFLLAFNGTLNGSTFEDNWGCSARDNGNDWTADPSTLCTYGRLVDTDGPIVAAKALGNDAVAFKPTSMYIGRFTGGDEIWTWTLLPWRVGCMGKLAVTVVKGTMFFLANDNLYAYDGASIRGLMDDRVRKWFMSNVGAVHRYYSRDAELIHDQQRGLLWMLFKDQNSNIQILTYHLESGRWGKASTEYIRHLVAVPYAYSGVSGAPYPGLPTTLAATLNDAKLYLCQRAYNSGTSPIIAPTPSMTTFDFGDDWNESELRAVRLRTLSNSGTITGTAYSRAKLTDVLITGTSAAETADGKFEIGTNKRWHRLKFDFTAYAEATGLSMDWSGRGAR